jgi:hypothetical protein
MLHDRQALNFQEMIIRWIAWRAQAFEARRETLLDSAQF